MFTYSVYILNCSDDSFYVGIMNDLDRRLFEHKNGLHRSCYTFKRRPVELAYSKQFYDVLEAIKCEKRLKKWSRAKKEALVRGEWDELPDLSRRRNVYLKKSQKECLTRIFSLLVILRDRSEATVVSKDA